MNEANYQLVINKDKSVGSMHCNNPKAFIDYSNDIDNIYESIDEYNPSKTSKIWFYLMI